MDNVQIFNKTNSSEDLLYSLDLKTTVKNKKKSPQSPIVKIRRKLSLGSNGRSNSLKNLTRYKCKFNLNDYEDSLRDSESVRNRPDFISSPRTHRSPKPFLELREFCTKVNNYVDLTLSPRNRSIKRIENLILVHRVSPVEQLMWVSPFDRENLNFNNKSPLYIGNDQKLYTGNFIHARSLNNDDLIILGTKGSYIQYMKNGVEKNYIITFQDFKNGILPIDLSIRNVKFITYQDDI